MAREYTVRTKEEKLALETAKDYLHLMQRDYPEEAVLKYSYEFLLSFA